jgi:hypothetical protein
MSTSDFVVNPRRLCLMTVTTTPMHSHVGQRLVPPPADAEQAITDSLGNGEGHAARTYRAEVKKWLGSTAEGSVLTGRQQEIHSQVLNETQHAMAGNPPVPFSA